MKLVTPAYTVNEVYTNRRRNRWTNTLQGRMNDTCIIGSLSYPLLQSIIWYVWPYRTGVDVQWMCHRAHFCNFTKKNFSLGNSHLPTGTKRNVLLMYGSVRATGKRSTPTRNRRWYGIARTVVSMTVWRLQKHNCNNKRWQWIHSILCYSFFICGSIVFSPPARNSSPRPITTNKIWHYEW